MAPFLENNLEGQSKKRKRKMGSDQVIIVFGSKDDHSKWNGTIPVEKSNGMTKNKWPNEMAPSL